MNPELPRRIVVFSVGRWRIGIRLKVVAQVIPAVEVTPIPDAPPHVLGVIDVRGQLVPVFSLRSRLKEPERKLSVSDRFILARAAGRDIAIVADEVLGVEELSPETLTPADVLVPGQPALQGVAQLAERLVLVEDLDRLVEALDSECFSEPSPTA